MGLLGKIITGIQNQKTYRVGLLQTKAYRVLKQRTQELLESSNISTVEWALLGVLNDNTKGMRLNLLADELGVEAPFVTRMITKLLKMGYINQIADFDDNRAKLVCLTKKGEDFVERTELHLRKEMKDMFKNSSKNDLLSYLSVLQNIVDNSDDKKNLH